MTAESARPPAPAPPEETTAGNYFVANYPPFPFWTAERITNAEAALERAPASGTALGLYLHIPFCRKRCHFCFFQVYTDKDSLQTRRCLDGGLHEMALYAGLPFGGGRKAQFVYFGGGT